MCIELIDVLMYLVVIHEVKNLYLSEMTFIFYKRKQQHLGKLSSTNREIRAEALNLIRNS